MTQRDAALDLITQSGLNGMDHESLEIALGAPKATVRRLTQELRKRDLIRLDRYDRAGVALFVASSMPVL